MDIRSSFGKHLYRSIHEKWLTSSANKTHSLQCYQIEASKKSFINFYNVKYPYISGASANIN